MLESLAIGSLPQNNLQDAMTFVKNNFEIPFWPQLVNISKNEDMTLQFLEGMPSFLDLNTFLNDYEKIIKQNDISLLEKYAISKNCSIAFESFIKLIKNGNYKFAKGQIIGPYTLLHTSDEYNPEIIVKLLTLKALWQVKKIKNLGITPIIFIDEPLIANTNYDKNVVNMIKSISGVIKQHGGISGVHCCGKCSWKIPIDANVNIINPDTYLYLDNFIKYHENIKQFLENKGKIAWGIVPSKEDIKNITTEKLLTKFEKGVNYLTKKGINEKLILENSYITTSCGIGSLSVKSAKKAILLTNELSTILKERYNDN